MTAPTAKRPVPRATLWFQLSSDSRVMERTSNATFIHPGHASNLFNTGFSELRNCVYNGPASVLAGCFIGLLSPRWPATAFRLREARDRGGLFGLIMISDDIALNCLPDALI